MTHQTPSLGKYQKLFSATLRLTNIYLLISWLKHYIRVHSNSGIQAKFMINTGQGVPTQSFPLIHRKCFHGINSPQKNMAIFQCHNLQIIVKLCVSVWACFDLFHFLFSPELNTCKEIIERFLSSCCVSCAIG